MQGNLFAHVLGILIFLAFGVVFTFFPKLVREYYFNAYKQNAERLGLFTSWIGKYPGHIVFRIAGIVGLAISVFLIILLIKKLQT